MDPYAATELLIPIAGMLTGVVIVGTIGWTVRHWVNRHYEHRERMRGGGSEDVRRLEERIAMLEESVGRVQDVEERLDFAERVLTQQRDAAGELGPGGRS
jgi:hypothetical protein